MKRLASAAVVAFGMAVFGVFLQEGIAAGPVGPQVPAPAAQRTIVGILEQVATFAQSTGWQVRRNVMASECDPSAVMRKAVRLQGQRVRATGYFETRQYPQGAVRVFIITRLERA